MNFEPINVEQFLKDFELKSVFTLTDESFVEGCWYLVTPTWDWMALVYRDTITSPWRATYRFRYYAEKEGEELDPWSGRDRKRRESFTGDTSEACRQRMVMSFDVLLQMMGEDVKGSRRIRKIIHGEAKHFWRWMLKQPWAHMKVTSMGPKRPQ